MAVSPFLMAVEDVFWIPNKGVVATGTIEWGNVSKGDVLDVVGIKVTPPVSVLEIGKAQKLVDSAGTGASVELLLGNVGQGDVVRGQVIATSGLVTAATQFRAHIYLRSKEEGGRHTPAFSTYEPEIELRTAKVAGTIALDRGVSMLVPGTDLMLGLNLSTPIALNRGMYFRLWEGTRVVGTGLLISIGMP
jgi:elongation factor Tu